MKNGRLEGISSYQEQHKVSLLPLLFKNKEVWVRFGQEKKNCHYIWHDSPLENSRKSTNLFNKQVKQVC